MYDGRVGRWMTIDPMEEFYSPYLAMGNDPINLGDPSGGKTDTWYESKLTGERVWVNDGYDGTIYLSDSDFQYASFIATILNGSNLAPSNQFADDYNDFFDEHLAYDKIGFSNALDYVWNKYGYGGGRLRYPILGGAGSLELTGGPTAPLNSSKILGTTSKQLQKKFKHAEDFGVLGNYNRVQASKFSAALNQHINSPGVKVINGTYRGDPVIHYLDPKTGLNVITKPDGTFISGWKLGESQMSHVLKHGGLN